MIRALIFDFDGLILDTEAPALQSWQELYAEHGADFPVDAWAATIGTAGGVFDPFAYLETQLGRPLDRAALRARRARRKLELTAAQELLPGVLDYLQAARRLGLAVGLASSSGFDWVGGHLERFGLSGHFACIRCAGDVARAKPEPDLYLAVLAALGVQPQEAIALEDSPNGVRAAKRAGLVCVAVPNPITGRFPLDHADLRLPSLAALPLEELLQRVEAMQPQRR